MNIRQIFFRKTVLGKLGIIMKIILSLCLITIAGFPGCASKKYRPGLVYKEWTRTMSQEGIFPVFPPREDIQVGDVWILPLHPLQTKTVELVGGLGQTGIWYDNIFIQKGTETTTVYDFYKERYAFPETSKLYPSLSKEDATTTESPESEDDVTKDAVKTFLSENASANLPDVQILKVPSDKDGLFKKGDVTRLRQVAFPEFSITNITQGALNALAPIEYFQVAGGLNFNRIDQISLKIPLAESYGIPLKKVYTSLRAKFENGTGTINLRYTDTAERNKFVSTLILARSQFNEALGRLTEAPGLWFYQGRIKKELEESKNYVWVALINEVFYARAMDISVSTTKGGGGGGRVEPITENMLNALDRLDKLQKVKKSTVTETTTANSDDTQTTGNATPTPTATPSGGTETTGIVKNIAITRQDDAFTLAQKINDFNAASGQQSTLGGSINVVSVSNTGVGLRRIYDRPIAVGVRGVIMKINVKNLRLGTNDGIPITLEEPKG